MLDLHLFVHVNTLFSELGNALTCSLSHIRVERAVPTWERTAKPFSRRVCTMTDKDIKIEHYYALTSVDFSVLERLELSQTDLPQQTPSDLSLNIVLHSPRR